MCSSSSFVHCLGTRFSSLRYFFFRLPTTVPPSTVWDGYLIFFSLIGNGIGHGHGLADSRRYDCRTFYISLNDDGHPPAVHLPCRPSVKLETHERSFLLLLVFGSFASLLVISVFSLLLLLLLIFYLSWVVRLACNRKTGTRWWLQREKAQSLGVFSHYLYSSKAGLWSCLPNALAHETTTLTTMPTT